MRRPHNLTKNKKYIKITFTTIDTIISKLSDFVVLVGTDPLNEDSADVDHFRLAIGNSGG